MSLSPKQKRLCQEYVKDLNKTAAAKRAGYSPRTSAEIARQVLKLPEAEEYVKELMQNVGDQLGITQKRVVEEYMKLAFADMSDYLDIRVERVDTGKIDKEGKPITMVRQSIILKNLDEMPEEKLSAISEVAETQSGIRIKLHDKKGALDSLARHLGMFLDQIEVHGQFNAQVEHSFDDESIEKAFQELYKE